VIVAEISIQNGRDRIKFAWSSSLDRLAVGAQARQTCLFCLVRQQWRSDSPFADMVPEV
jgi:hypothetical protein